MKTYFLFMFFTFIQFLQAQQSDFKTIDFTKAEYLAERYKGEELTNLPILAHHLTYTLDTDVERFRAIYYWVCHNIKGEYGLMQKNNRKRQKLKDHPAILHAWNHQFKRQVFKKLINDKETLCTGYAYLIKELSRLAGLECKIVNGYGLDGSMKSKNLDIPNHSWNAIKLQGKWYLCDATWSSGFTDVTTELFEFDYDNSFFLMKPSIFIKTHQPVDETWTLLPEK
ncbi:transglutaminase domain-containing protein [uncultured Dokdonia sp.]|uniref:transglutaminase domain-containing protein n=1 Tax=uncultured Dokdonia sp. TaxID=575653 RepID=UPI00261D7DAE|nr:transglutaminase domain-containing protein [uncultured Dokdonia sp.]